MENFGVILVYVSDLGPNLGFYVIVISVPEGGGCSTTLVSGTNVEDHTPGGIYNL